MMLEANPVVKGLITIATIIGIAFAATSYFATAADVAKIEVNTGVGLLRLEVGQLEGQRRAAENSMFDAKTPQAKERYKLQVDQLTAEKLAKQRRLDELTTGKR